jgi:hypothetical protein
MRHLQHLLLTSYVSYSPLPSLLLQALIITASLPHLGPRLLAATRAIVTNPVIRAGILRPNCQINTHYTSNIEAYIGQLIGVLNNPCCTYCTIQGVGCWTECVSVPRHFSNSCCNYYYNNEGICCSLHKFIGL